MPREAPIEIVAYSPDWARNFAAEAAQLAAALAPWLVAGLEHIGSTAVPALAAKPVIDIMGPVASLPDSMDAIDAAQTCGYCYSPYKPEQMHWFCKPSLALRTHHLHLVPYGSRLWRERLAFRDALRADAALAARYAQLKRTLGLQYPNDREAYTEGKTAFVQEVLARVNQGHGTG